MNDLNTCTLIDNVDISAAVENILYHKVYDRYKFTIHKISDAGIGFYYYGLLPHDSIILELRKIIIETIEEEYCEVEQLLIGYKK